MSIWAHPAPSDETVLRALRLAGGEYTGNLWWRRDDAGALRIFVLCPDFFAWGGADLEEITDATIESLEATVQECEALLGRDNADDAFLLWCARQRGKRPQGAYYNSLEEALWPLFDACGPAREVGLGNPHPHPAQD